MFQFKVRREQCFCCGSGDFLWAVPQAGAPVRAPAWTPEAENVYHSILRSRRLESQSLESQSSLLKSWACIAFCHGAGSGMAAFSGNTLSGGTRRALPPPQSQNAYFMGYVEKLKFPRKVGHEWYFCCGRGGLFNGNTSSRSTRRAPASTPPSSPSLSAADCPASASTSGHIWPLLCNTSSLSMHQSRPLHESQFLHFFP